VSDEPRRRPPRLTKADAAGPVRVSLNFASRLFDALETRWERLLARRTLATVLVAVFLGALALIEAQRRGWLPPPLAGRVATNHFVAVAVAFTLLLYIEILALVFALAQSVANSVGKQFELFSLILLRKAFLQLGNVGEPLEWHRVAGAVPGMLADIGGALAVFVLVGIYYRIQRHQPITKDEEEQARFVASKKAVSLILLAAFLLLAVLDARQFLLGRPTFDFFEVFFTILVFSDVLLVLIALGYSYGYHVVFRNSGFAAATVMLRLALTAPIYINALLGLGAATFAVALSLAYNSFAPLLRERAPAMRMAP